MAEQFARQLASLLDEARASQRYARVVLLAKPRFLGNLRGISSAPTAALVTATLDKHLGNVGERDLARHLNGIVRL